nr:MAG TPA: hypothetical protein [Caudoviricetes sp.]
MNSAEPTSPSTPPMISPTINLNMVSSCLLQPW